MRNEKVRPHRAYHTMHTLYRYIYIYIWKPFTRRNNEEKGTGRPKGKRLFLLLLLLCASFQNRHTISIRIRWCRKYDLANTISYNIINVFIYIIIASLAGTFVRPFEYFCISFSFIQSVCIIIFFCSFLEKLRQFFFCIIVEKNANERWFSVSASEPYGMAGDDFDDMFMIMRWKISQTWTYFHFFLLSLTSNASWPSPQFDCNEWAI